MQKKSLDPINIAEVEALNDLINNADISDFACYQLFLHLGFMQNSYKLWIYNRLPAWFRRMIGLPPMTFFTDWINFFKIVVISPASTIIIPIIISLSVYFTTKPQASSALQTYKSIPVATTFTSLSSSRTPPTTLIANALPTNSSGSSAPQTSPIAPAANAGTFTFAILAFIVGYQRWVLAENNRNVDDAIRRKELANKMIVDNAIVLRPYVANVFDIEERFAHTMQKQEDRIKIQMYIFTEIDNLEFVFDKSRSGLIQIQYALRAIKIFVARAENSGFEQLARDLVRNGRYNREFVSCVESLLDVGYWIRSIQHEIATASRIV